MCKCSFYYDESEHSRKINHKTITAENYSDSFIAVVVGWLSDGQTDLSERYVAFEEKYQHRKSKGELKSTTLKQSQLTRGLASLNNDNLSLLEDFFDLFDGEIYVYYAVISKIEYIVRQIFADYKNNPFVNMDAMKYSITKALLTYQPQDIFDGLYENTGELIDLLKDFFSSQIKKDKANMRLKQAEIESFKQILLLLNDVSGIRKIEWDYDTAFIGFKKYLVEKSVDDYSLTIDREGENSNTAKSAERVGLCNVVEADSTSLCGIRMADMLAGIISKLIKALHNDLRPTATDGAQLSKTLLDKSWFMVNERQLALYKKIYYVAVELNKAWYKAFAGIYSDDLIVFIAFLGFMNHFDSINDVGSKIDMQGEYFNAYACQSLSDYFARMRNKLPIDPVGDTSKKFVLNQRGAKVYFDSSKQPLLDMRNMSICCDVLSVGFSKERMPMVTVQEKNKVKCYRIPAELSEWVITMVGLANVGANLFPAKVIFSYKNGRYCADIL